MGRILLYCQPGARQSQLCGLHDGKPKVRLQARPVDGAANQTLIAFLAQHLQRPASAIRIESGATSRTKRVAVDGLDDDQLLSLLA
jgi:uncharacterized protein (TIGR00251 family)